MWFCEDIVDKVMRKRVSMQRFLVLLIGIFIALLSLEVGLRLLGFISKKDIGVPAQSFVAGKAKPYVILCLGNSFTEGVGAPPQMSYPAQLQRMCDGKMQGKNIVVINKGESAQNSAELLIKLNSNINTYNPDLIILQTGQPNEWNYLRYTDYLNRKDKEGSFLKRVHYYFLELFSEFRVFRLYLLFKGNLKVKHDHATALVVNRQPKEYTEAGQFILTTATRLAVDKAFVVDQAMVRRSLGVFKEWTKKDPEAPLNYAAVGYLYRLQGNDDEALKWFIKGVIVGRPDNRDKMYAYNGLRRLRRVDKGVHNDEINKKIDKFIDRYTKSNPDIAFQLKLLSDAEIGAWLESDLKEIVDIIRHKKIRIIVQNYP